MKEMTMTKLAALSVICAAIVLVLAVGLALLADHLIGQRQEAAKPAEQVQPQEEKEKEKKRTTQVFSKFLALKHDIYSVGYWRIAK